MAAFQNQPECTETEQYMAGTASVSGKGMAAVAPDYPELPGNRGFLGRGGPAVSPDVREQGGLNEIHLL